MHCTYCGADYNTGEVCLCSPPNLAADDDREPSAKAHAVLEYPGETDGFCSLSTDPSRGGIP
jgi:hypothetical protein